MTLFTSEKILEFFVDYVEEASVMSYPGFLKHCALKRQLSPESLRDLKEVFKEDLPLLNYIKSICEGDIVEQALLGTINGNMSQFVLKHKHGYEDKETNVAPILPTINIINEG